MTDSQKRPLRTRQYTYYEMLAWAKYYHENWHTTSPEMLLRSFLQWKEVDGATDEKTLRLLVVEKIVVDYYGLNMADVRGKRRYLELVRARQVIAYFSVKLASQYFISAALGVKRDSVQFGKTKCGILMENDKQLRHEVEQIEQRIEEKFKTMDAALEATIKKLEDGNDGNDQPADGAASQGDEGSALHGTKAL